MNRRSFLSFLGLSAAAAVGINEVAKSKAPEWFPTVPQKPFKPYLLPQTKDYIRAMRQYDPAFATGGPGRVNVQGRWKLQRGYNELCSQMLDAAAGTYS